jgi:hypothetical protein
MNIKLGEIAVITAIKHVCKRGRNSSGNVRSAVARSWRGLSAHTTVKFRHSEKNSATFLPFHIYVMKSRIGIKK